MFASRKHVTDVAKPLINQVPNVAPAVSSQTNQQKLELARKLAARINYQKNLGPEAQDISQQAAIAIMKGDSVVVPQVAVSAALLLSPLLVPLVPWVCVSSHTLVYILSVFLSSGCVSP